MRYSDIIKLADLLTTHGYNVCAYLVHKPKLNSSKKQRRPQWLWRRVPFWHWSHMIFSVCRKQHMGRIKGRIFSGHVYVSHTTQTSLLRRKSDHTVLSAVLHRCRCFHLAVALLWENWNQYVYIMNTRIIVRSVYTCTVTARWSTSITNHTFHWLQAHAVYIDPTQRTLKTVRYRP